MKKKNQQRANKGRVNNRVQPKSDLYAPQTKQAKNPLQTKMAEPAITNGQTKKGEQPNITVSASINGKPSKTLQPRSRLASPSSPPVVPEGLLQSIIPVAQLAAELQTLQRQRAWYLKSRIMIANRLQATVAGYRGYSSNQEEKVRRQRFAEASNIIQQIGKGTITEAPYLEIVRTTLLSITGFNQAIARLEKQMLAFAKQLPVVAWVQAPEQRGFGVLFLGIVIGETGDLAGYTNPAKVWKRLGCAPFVADGQTHMGATWRAGREGKLSAEQWAAFGYSPRRRSIAYLIGEGLCKQNFLRGGVCGVTEGPTAFEEADEGHHVTKQALVSEETDEKVDETGVELEDGEDGEGNGVNGLSVAGPYRLRYLEAKVRAYATHPEWDWSPCLVCKGKGKSCSTCGGTGQKCKRAHLHGMLLATKLLLKNLWIEWHDHPKHVKNW